ncbi:hypothetical protein [Haliangium sp.]|uniref:hypothetical protein n=1 Tax=Haliangium sp. TaxID=2663208 RepID=UPI003D1202D1
MSVRRLLLIDNDDDFHRLLQEQLGPYGFEIHLVAPGPDALIHVTRLEPVLVFIAVEEPDKLGYSLCNKAKKGVARELKVVLTTSSVPPSGFQSHRRLKVHADEYLDKRTMSTEELINKVDALIGLGEAQSEVMEFPLEVEEIDIEEAEEVLIEDIEVNPFGADEDDEEKTRIAPPDIIADALGDEAEAMIAALSDEPELESLDLAELDAELNAELDIETSAPSPEPRPGPAAPADVESDPGGFAEPSPTLDITATNQPAPLPRAEPATPAAPLDADDVPEVESTYEFGPEEATALREAARVSAQPLSNARFDKLEQDNERLRRDGDALRAELERLRADSAELERLRAGNAELERLRADSAELRASREADQERMRSLDEDKQRMQAEIERLRAEAEAAPAAEAQESSSFSREREFLNLREIINRKEREILDLRDEAGVKDREILERKEQIRKLEHSKTALDAKNLELEQRILAQNEDKESLEQTRKSLEGERSALISKVEALGAELEAFRSQARTEIERLEAALAARQQEHESAREQLERDHQSALEALRGEHEQALAALAEKHQAALADAGKEHQDALDRARAQAAADQEEALRQQQQAHDAALAEANSSAQAEREQALAALAAKHAEALEQVENGHAQALKERDRAAQEALEDLRDKTHADIGAAKREYEQSLERAVEAHVAEKTALLEEQSKLRQELEERHAAAIQASEEAQRGLEGQLERVRDQLEERERTLAEHKTQLEAKSASIEDLRTQLEGRERELSAARDELAARDQTIAEQGQTLDQRHERIGALDAERAELESQNADYQEQVLTAYRKIKSDEAAIDRAKKALAIALTLLDETSAGAPAALADEAQASPDDAG